MTELRSIPAHLLWYGAHTPEKTAVIADDGSITYGALALQVRSIAAALREKGVKKGDRVVSMASDTISYVAMCYGIQLLGAVDVPVENRAPVSRVAEIAAAVGAALIVSPEDPCCGIAHSTAEALTAGCGGDDIVPPEVDGSVAEIIYTTGTTGKSKGVMVSVSSLAHYVYTCNPSFDMDENTVFLICTPVNHAGGLRRLHMSMAAGCTVVLLDGIRDLRKFFNYIRDYHVTATYLPPASIRVLLTLASQELKKLDGQLDFIYTASSAFPAADIDTLCTLMFKTRLYQGYGGSETGSVSHFRYNEPGASRTCLGKPLDGVELRLTDSDGNIVTGANNEGFISVHSPMNMNGYYNEPELTASVLSADGWVRTSDIGYFDEQGRLFFAGRGDDVINVGGFKVSPTDVESAALRLSGIADCVCTSRETRMGTALRLLVVMKEGCEFLPKEIAAGLRAVLEPYKVPQLIEQIDEVPRTFNGKINRKVLR